jgi:thiol-disulfide isomerase/thioredoxin
VRSIAKACLSQSIKEGVPLRVSDPDAGSVRVAAHPTAVGGGAAAAGEKKDDCKLQSDHCKLQNGRTVNSRWEPVMVRSVSYSILLATAFAFSVWTMPGPAAELATACTVDTVTLQTLSWTDAQPLFVAHPGKVVLVDVWTTTCPTCVAHFADFVALHEQLRPRDLVCISVNCDHDGIPDKPPSYYAPRVLEFLKQHDACLTNLLLADPLIDFLNAAAIEATPTYRLYGRDGKLLREFDGSVEEFTFDQVAQAVKSAVSRGDEVAPAQEGN